MSNIGIITFVISTIIILILLGIIIFIITKNIKSNTHKKYEKKTKKIFENIQFELLENKLDKIMHIAENNTSYKDKAITFENRFEKLDEKYKTLSLKFQEFLATTNNKKKIELSKSFSKLKKESILLEEYIQEFLSSANILLEPEQFLLEEFHFYQERYKIIKHFYQNIIVSIEILSKPLIEMNNKIKQYHDEVQNYCDKGQYKQCAISLNNYRSELIKFSKILNDAKIIQEMIYTRIPTSMKKLYDHFSKINKSPYYSLDHINFIKVIKIIRDKYLLLKDYFKNLNMEKCKLNIIWIFKNMKSLEQLINYEITAQHNVSSYYGEFKSQTYEILKNYVIMNKQIKKLKNDNQISEEEIELSQQMTNVAREIDIAAMWLKNNVKNYKIPFTSKKYKLKLVFELEHSLLEMMNKLLIKISKSKNFVLNYSNKLIYFESIIAELYASIHSLDIELNDVEKDNLYKIDKQIFELQEELNLVNFNRKYIINKLNNLQPKIISIYKLIATKKEAASIVRNLLSYFASKRKLNDSFNQKISYAEKQYLSSEYIKSLNTVISAIEMEK